MSKGELFRNDSLKTIILITHLHINGRLIPTLYYPETFKSDHLLVDNLLAVSISDPGYGAIKEGW